MSRKSKKEQGLLMEALHWTDRLSEVWISITEARAR